MSQDVVADVATEQSSARVMKRQSFSKGSKRTSLGRTRSSSVPQDRIPDRIASITEGGDRRISDLCVSGWYDDEDDEESDHGQVYEGTIQRGMSSRVSNRVAHVFGKFSRTAGRNKG